MRIDRLLSNTGSGSRVDAGHAVRSGRVEVAGEVVRDPSRHADAAVVLVDGQPLDHPDGVLVVLHKPVGYVCTHNAEEGETVYELLPPAWAGRNPRPEAAGRLDRETSGLLVVTDDHQLLHRLTSPRQHITKTYRATLARPLTDELIEQFAGGALLLRGETEPCRAAEVVAHGDLVAEVTLSEGRYHQVRRMFTACGNHVEQLHRIRVGDWSLDDLPPGEWRDVPKP